MDQDELSLATLVARIDERTEITAAQVDKLAHVLLEGNGVPAITTQVATLVAKVTNLEEVNRDRRVPLQVWIPLVVSLVLGVLGLLLDGKVV